MRVEKDYEGLFRLFNKHRVRYCIIGSYAVAFYARPRYTKDIDILIEPNVDNSERVVRALNEFGFESLALSAAAQLGPLVDYLDLDGHWLLARDPFDGAPRERGRIELTERPGLGVTPVAGGTA